jgi:homoserine kinase
MKSIRAYAPATVANVCCGFDILGFPVDEPADEVVITLKDEPGIVVTKITGDGGKLPLAAEKNTASVAVQSYLNSLGKSVGATIELHKGLPLGSGMGSSAASGVAALVAINELMGNPMKREELVPHAMEAERVACGAAHADNVAPSLLGGFVLIRNYHPLDVVAIPTPENLFCTLVHPHLELKTEDSRKVLKQSLPLKDAIAQSGNVAGLVLGLMKSDFDLIGRSLVDKIAEPIRSVFIPGFEEIRSAVKSSGGIGCGISGSGPTLFALSSSRELAVKLGEVMQQKFLQYKLVSDVFVSKVNQNGAGIRN